MSQYGTNQNTTKEITYDTYGNILTDSNSSLKVPFGFAGRLYDTDTKLVHFGYREYDSFTGKWSANDPLLFGGGNSNLYGYVLGDPVDLVDPDGRNALAVVEGLGLLYGGWLLFHPNTNIGQAIVDWWNTPATNASPSISLPWNGVPNSTDRCRREDGTPKQKRRYGPDGTPL
jgi:RHS repeat-associated protein